MKNIVEKIINIIFPPRDESGFFINWNYQDFRNKLQVGNNHEKYTPLFSYRDPKVRLLIKSFKKERINSIGKNVSMILAEEILNFFNDEAISSKQNIYIVPIPISNKRLKERGFNQTDWIANLAVKELGEGFYLSSKFLTKTKETQKQSTLSRSERLKNPKDSFRAPFDLSNKKIILVDDVITTGATVNEALRALKKAGAKNIHIYCIAH
jgi:competence protein ComFC